MPTLLEVEGVEVWYGSVHALQGVDLQVGDAECVGIVGPNGAGKTTLMNAISRLVTYTGEVRLDGRRLSGKPEDVVLKGVAHVLEGRQVFGSLTVKENLLLARFGSRGGDFKQRLEAVLEFFPILRPRLSSLGGQLSGGQQQILAIARGLLTAPRVLLLDEPSLGLAPVVIEQLAQSIPAMREEWQTAVLISEQMLQLVLEVASRVYVLSGGRVVDSGPASSTLLSHGLVATYLGE